MELIDRIRQDEYTGENRCGPCTVLNVVIATILYFIISRKSKLGGIVIGGLSILIVYFRGYLIPGTPSLTKKYLPENVLQWFGKESTPNLNTGLGAGSTPKVDSADDKTVENTNTEQETDSELEMTAEQYLLEQQIIEPCEDVDDLCLSTEFETAWLEKIDQIDVDNITADDAASLIGNNTDDELEVVEYGGARVININGAQVGKWPSDAAVIADVTAAHLLEERDQDWSQYKPEQKGELLMSVRLFLKKCPTSGGKISMNEEVVESCCQSHKIIAVTCDETGERLFEHPIDDFET